MMRRFRPYLQRIAVTSLVSFFLILPACRGGGGTSSALPTAVTVGVPVSDTVFLSRTRTYAAQVNPGALYKISITGLTDDADLFIYDDDDAFTTPFLCSVDNTNIVGPSNEACIIPASGSSFYFSVDGSFLTTARASYTVVIEQLSPAVLNPSIPASDTIARTSAGVYAVQAAEAGNYTISVTGLTDDVELSVFGNDGTFGEPLICSFDNTRLIGASPEDCTSLFSAGTLYFVVDGIFSTTAAATYTILSTPATLPSAPVSQGSLTAPEAVIIHTPASGQVGPAGTSYYRADSLAPGARYTVSITGMSGDVELAVSLDGAFTTEAACLIDNTSLLGIFPEDCTLAAPTEGTLFFTVTAGAGAAAGSGYTILVEPGP